MARVAAYPSRRVYPAGHGLRLRTSAVVEAAPHFASARPCGSWSNGADELSTPVDCAGFHFLWVRFWPVWTDRLSSRSRDWTRDILHASATEPALAPAFPLRAFRVAVAGPREIADGVMFKFEVAPIFEPLDAVPRPRARGQVIEGIPVGVQDVHQAVPIEVYQPDAAAAVVFVGAAPNQVRLEVSMSIVLKNVDLLPFLAHQADNVHLAVVVDIRGYRMDDSREALQYVRTELPITEVLHPTGFAVVITELAHDQVQTAIAVKIGGTNVGDPGNVIDDGMRGKVLLAIVLQDDHRADLVIAGKKLTHAGHQHIQVAIPIDIDGAHVRGGGQHGADPSFRINPARELPDPAHTIRQHVGH